MLALAYRVPVYDGMMAARIRATPEAARPKTANTKTEIQSDPLLREVIDFG